ncbi:MAG: glycoside hydrolase family 127 protein [Firmicutes bacterium]|nr:glycoside hydrolase family 127 protein [Bacillota bacterium]
MAGNGEGDLLLLPNVVKKKTRDKICDTSLLCAELPEHDSKDNAFAYSVQLIGKWGRITVKTEIHRFKPLPLNKVKLNGGFWGEKNRLAREKVIPVQWRILNDELPGAELSHVIKNFRIVTGETNGQFHGMVFQDSDLAKWLEAVAYSLTTNPDPQLEALADEMINLIGRAQQADGYLNTYYTLKEPEKRWSNLRVCHELYTAGHMIEAAVAYYQATGKDKFLKQMCKFADYIDGVFGREEGKKPGYPGHEEIELALIKLYRVTGEERYLKLSKFFIDQRGQEPNYFVLEAEAAGEEFSADNKHFGLKYYQAHLPVREQVTMEGHAVRAMYLLCGVIDLAIETGDNTLLETAHRLWKNVTQQKMYLTGGVGASSYGEAFSFDYDLPNSTAYAETCAAIGLVFVAHRMLQLMPEREYADIMEKALYNGVLSGISLDGESFFYVNPLAVSPEVCEKRHDHSHVEPERQKWFACACCPPNLARVLTSIGEYFYTVNQNEVYIHLYGNNIAKVGLDEGEVQLTQETAYPWEGTVRISVSTEQPVRFTLALRIPGWCRQAQVCINGEELNLSTGLERGYAKISRWWNNGDRVELSMAMPVERIYSHPLVAANLGRVALQRGPIIYCLEEIDNGPNLAAISLPSGSKLTTQYRPDLLGGVTVITGEAMRVSADNWGNSLYAPQPPMKVKTGFTAVPYYAWNNRGRGEMLVWIRET